MSTNQAGIIIPAQGDGATHQRFISPIVVSTIMGHSGNGMFPLTLLPAYRRLREVIWETDTTILTKSSTAKPHSGNFHLWLPWTWKYVQRIGRFSERCGLLNAYGLTNGGAALNGSDIYWATHKDYNVVPNLYPQFAKGRETAIKETVEAIRTYQSYLKTTLWAIELSYSCPNSAEQIGQNAADALACTSAVKTAFPALTQIAKTSIVHRPDFARALVESGVGIIHAVNSIPWGLVFPNQESPLAKVGGGGVSGGPAFPQALAYNKRLRQELGDDVPIIMGCGVMSVGNAQRYFDTGANSVSICTVCRLDPREAIRIVRQFNR